MGALALAAVSSLPRRQGLRTSDLLDVDAPLRDALLRVVRSGTTTVPDLAADLGVPEDDAVAVADALVERGALETADGRQYRLPRKAPEARRPRGLLDDLLDLGGG